MEPHVIRWLEARPARPAQDFKFLSANELNLLTYAHPGHPISGDATTTRKENR